MNSIILSGKYGGKSVILDDEDYAAYKDLVVFGHSKGYATIIIKNRSYLLHRLVMKAPKKTEVDHINRNKLDNRKSNLRLCSRSTNAQNQKSWAKSGYKGVNKNGKYWQANIYKDTKRIFLGNFHTKEEAALAYNEAASKLYGHLAYLNPTHKTLN